MDRRNISWHLAPAVQSELAELEKNLGSSAYAGQRQAIQDFLSGYVGAEPRCLGKQGDSISPLGSTSKGGKILKVRWALPGQGKSGSLRLAFVTRCEQQVVILAAIFQRRDDPPSGLFIQAAEYADPG